jgi:predicted transcriptional regulator
MARYTVDFNESFDKLLSELAKEKGMTKAEIIRRAISSYAFLENEVNINDKNRKLSITDKEGQVIKDILLP